MAAYVELRSGDDTAVIHGVGQDADALAASIQALVSAANRLAAATPQRQAAAG